MHEHERHQLVVNVVCQHGLVVFHHILEDFEVSFRLGKATAAVYGHGLVEDTL